VEIDAAVVLVLLGVEAHDGSPPGWSDWPHTLI
jgi:hypothetical protein